jgi:transcriptional regulator with XRE-family HTH domain
MRRMMIGMSQEKLGDSLGLTFQQVQKYEKGANRIGASRLFHISRVLGVSIGFFYEGLPDAGQPGEMDQAEADQSAFELDMLSSSEGIQLNSAFFSIRDARVRKKVLELVKALGDAAALEEDEGPGIALVDDPEDEDVV